MNPDTTTLFTPEDNLPQGFANRVMVAIQAEKLRQIELRSRRESLLWAILLIVLGCFAVGLADRAGWLQVQSFQEAMPLGPSQLLLLVSLGTFVWLLDAILGKLLVSGDLVAR